MPCPPALQGIRAITLPELCASAAQVDGLELPERDKPSSQQAPTCVEVRASFDYQALRAHARANIKHVRTTSDEAMLRRGCRHAWALVEGHSHKLLRGANSDECSAAPLRLRLIVLLSPEA